MKFSRYLIPAVVIIVVVGLFSLFTVHQIELAILLKLGEIQRSDYKPGLHVKVPVINNVKKFDSRILTLDAEPERFLTSEKKDVIVDSFVMWRITNVDNYYKATGGDERRAGILIYQRINDNLRGEFGKRTVKEVVSDERASMMAIVTKRANEAAEELGVSIKDVRLKRIDLPSEVSNAVYLRMRAERERVARDFRSRGAEAAERIRASADRERTVIIAEAFRDAETLRGEGDAESADIYARAYGQDEEFYSFYRSLNAYTTSFDSKDDILLLKPQGEFFKYLEGPGAQ